MAEEKKNPSFVTCEIEQQVEYLEGFEDGTYLDILIRKLEAAENIKAWALIEHDKDTKEDGTLKPKHIHIGIRLYHGVKASTIGNYVGVPAQCVERPKQKIGLGKNAKSDFGGILSYLTHRNASEKYQYSDDEVIAKPGYDWKAERAKSEAARAADKSVRKLLTAIESGEVRRYNLTQHISMQTYIDYKSEIDKAFEYRALQLKSNPNRNVEVIYIYGSPSTGKTTIAKRFCENKKLSYCISGSSRDPVQDYDGQDVLILDELRSEAFDLADLLKLLDNNSGSSVKARYRDKWLEVQYIIITTVLSLTDFYAAMNENDYEPIEQLQRRCKTVIFLTRDKMYVSRYDKVKRTYINVGVGANPAADVIAVNEAKEAEAASAVCAGFGVEYHPQNNSDKEAKKPP